MKRNETENNIRSPCCEGKCEKTKVYINAVIRPTKWCNLARNIVSLQDDDDGEDD